MANKTDGVVVLAIQQVPSNNVVVSDEILLPTEIEVLASILMGKDTTSAFTSPVQFRWEASPLESGNRVWVPVASFLSAAVAAESEAVTGTPAAGDRVIGMASTANLAKGQFIFLKHTTLVNSEWHQIKDLASNTSVTVIDPLTNTQTGATLYNQAERFVTRIGVASFKRLRLVVDANNTGQSFCVRADLSKAA